MKHLLQFSLIIICSMVIISCITLNRSVYAPDNIPTLNRQIIKSLPNKKVKFTYIPDINGDNISFATRDSFGVAYYSLEGNKHLLALLNDLMTTKFDSITDEASDSIQITSKFEADTEHPWRLLITLTIATNVNGKKNVKSVGYQIIDFSKTFSTSTKMVDATDCFIAVILDADRAINNAYNIH